MVDEQLHGDAEDHAEYGAEDEECLKDGQPSPGRTAAGSAETDRPMSFCTPYERPCGPGSFAIGGSVPRLLHLARACAICDSASLCGAAVRAGFWDN
jgi:hypothetical protein